MQNTKDRAHPQTGAIQRARAQRGQASHIPKNPPDVPISSSSQYLQVPPSCLDKRSRNPKGIPKIVITPPDPDPDQPRRSSGQMPLASSMRRSTSVSRPSRIPIPVKRAVPRPSTVETQQEVIQSLKNESALPQQTTIPIHETPRRSVCKSYRSRTSKPDQHQRIRSPVSAEQKESTPRKLVARRLFTDNEDDQRAQTPQLPRRSSHYLSYSGPSYNYTQSPAGTGEDTGISILKDAGDLSPAYLPEWSFSEIQDMIDDEKKEIRNMQSVVSQLMEPARQVQFKDMYSLVPHIFLDETETEPEVAAAILHSDEKGLSLKTTPAKLYDTLFQGGEADRTVMKVNAPSSHSKAGVLVPLSSQGVEASFIGYEPAGMYEVIPQEGESKMPSPSKRDGTDIGSVRDNLGYSASKGSQVSVSSEDGQFKIILQPDVPKESDLIQIRGSQPPPWFPGYYSMMGDNTAINVTNKPWTVLERAWREFIPQKINSGTGKIIVGS